jgi:hypothetical protein
MECFLERTRFLLVTVSLSIGLASCGSNHTSPGSDGGSEPDAGEQIPAPDPVAEAVIGLVQADPRFATQTLQDASVYEELAARIAQIEGVVSAQYTDDQLGTIWLEVKDKGIYVWSHLEDSFSETLPVGFDFASLADPVYQTDWLPPEVVIHPRALTENDWGTPFPTGALNDAEFSLDDPVQCAPQGRVAIVDFLHSEFTAGGQYKNKALYDTDGVPLWDRLASVFRAAGYEVVRYDDRQMTVAKLTELQDFDLVIMHGHGTRPSVKGKKNGNGKVFPWMLTDEIYSDIKVGPAGWPYPALMRGGYIIGHIHPGFLTIDWSPMLINALYTPARPQGWVLNQCWLLSGWAWGLLGPTQEVGTYSFGHALIERGVKVAMGYATPSHGAAVRDNMMRLARRTVGGYSSHDPVPPQFGMTYWPQCMALQTFFRTKANPDQAWLASKLDLFALFTMIAGPDMLWPREVCSDQAQAATGPILSLEEFVLGHGNPATVFDQCWNENWSTGTPPSPGSVCSYGNRANSKTAADWSACRVRFARKATNEIIRR